MGNSCSSDKQPVVESQPHLKPQPVADGNTGQSKAPPPSGAVSDGPPRSLDAYEIEATLGVGASCKVQAVKEKGTGKKYAVKVIQKNDQFKEQWAVEVRILRLLKHPHILDYVTSFEEKNELFIVTGELT